MLYQARYIFMIKMENNKYHVESAWVIIGELFLLFISFYLINPTWLPEWLNTLINDLGPLLGIAICLLIFKTSDDVAYKIESILQKIRPL